MWCKGNFREGKPRVIEHLPVTCRGSGLSQILLNWNHNSRSRLYSPTYSAPRQDRMTCSSELKFLLSLPLLRAPALCHLCHPHARPPKLCISSGQAVRLYPPHLSTLPALLSLPLFSALLDAGGGLLPETPRAALPSCFLEGGPQTSSTAMTWELVRKAESWSSPAPLNQNLHLNKIPRGADVC